MNGLQRQYQVHNRPAVSPRQGRSLDHFSLRRGWLHVRWAAHWRWKGGKEPPNRYGYLKFLILLTLGLPVRWPCGAGAREHKRSFVNSFPGSPDPQQGGTMRCLLGQESSVPATSLPFLDQAYITHQEDSPSAHGLFINILGSHTKPSITEDTVSGGKVEVPE